MQWNDFQPLEYQSELDSLIQDPDIRSNMDAIRGILFTNPMLFVYKKGDKEKSEEMDTETDRFYSKLGIAFLEQYLKYGVIFWYFKRIKGEVKAFTPEIKGIIKIRQVRDKIKLGWFADVNNYEEHEQNKHMLFYIKDIPDYKNKKFTSKLMPLIDYFRELKHLKNIILRLENKKLNPDYYLQNQTLPIAGENTSNALDSHISYYRDNEGKDDCVTRDPDDHWQIPSSLLDLYRTELKEDIFTNQDTGGEEEFGIPARTDEYIKQYGIPFFKHTRVNTYNVFGPDKKIPVSKFGPSISPQFVNLKEVNMKYYENLERKLVELINKVFGFQNLRNLDKTKLGSTILIEILNENINNFKDIIEEMLTQVYRFLIKRTKDESRQFVGIKISPKHYIPETIVTTIIKLYPKHPEVINEMLEKTSIMPLESLKKIKDIIVGDGQKDPFEKEDEMEKDEFKKEENKEEDKKEEEEGKKRKRDEEEDEEKSNKKLKLSFEKILSKTLKFKKTQYCKFKCGDCPKIQEDLRVGLNGKQFIIQSTVNNFFGGNLFNNPNLWTNTIISDYLHFYKNPNFDVLYYGYVKDTHDYRVISEKNLLLIESG